MHASIWCQSLECVMCQLSSATAGGCMCVCVNLILGFASLNAFVFRLWRRKRNWNCAVLSWKEMPRSTVNKTSKPWDSWKRWSGREKRWGAWEGIRTGGGAECWRVLTLVGSSGAVIAVREAWGGTGTPAGERPVQGAGQKADWANRQAGASAAEVTGGGATAEDTPPQNHFQLSSGEEQLEELEEEGFYEGAVLR